VNIILGRENVEHLTDKYVVLELDTLKLAADTEPVTAYCILENLSLEDMLTVDEFRTLHQNLMKNYRLKNWKFCEDALEHLSGKWHGDLDSFYDSLEERVKQYKETDPGDGWSGVINKT
jgi:hypothetical protein